jgi:hypothetical protein
MPAARSSSPVNRSADRTASTPKPGRSSSMSGTVPMALALTSLALTSKTYSQNCLALAVGCKCAVRMSDTR